MTDGLDRPVCEVHVSGENVPAVSVLEDRVTGTFVVVVNRRKLLADPERVMAQLGPHLSVVVKRRSAQIELMRSTLAS